MDEPVGSGDRALVGYEMLRPGELRQRVDAASIAYVPIGPLEFHGPHLPSGVDLLTADALCRRTAALVGGVVLPPLYVASGVLPLPHGITFPLDTLRAVVRSVLDQLAEGGFEVIVVFSGHGALDHLHVLREECDRLMSRQPTVRALTTIWNELTADIPGDIHDHGAKVETSYMMELWPDTVDLETLADDPGAEHVGVYAANPRFTASREWGETLSAHVVGRLADRLRGLVAGQPADNWADLRSLVGRLQAGDLEVVRDSARITNAGFALELYNPHGQSKYLTAVPSVTWDGGEIDPSRLTLCNQSVGERSDAYSVATLGPLA
ncbi:MAG: creatininase family protein, partial [Acidimicrobiia bacterium]|nr:creatininase family protein [Acidimicrobiia bacterium]